SSSRAASSASCSNLCSSASSADAAAPRPTFSPGIGPGYHRYNRGMARDAAALSEFLVRTPFFGGLDGEALRRIVGMTVQRAFASGESVFRQGEQGRSMYVVQSGAMVAMQNGDSGRPRYLVRLLSARFFSDTALFEGA